MTKIFISYRRVDTGPWAERLFKELAKRFTKSQLFMDTESIRAGTNWVENIDKNLKECDVLLALIGPRWLDCTRRDGSRRRLDVLDDWVRVEIVTAIGRNIPVIPILLGNAKFPDQSEFKNDLELQHFCKQEASKAKFITEDQVQWDRNIHILVKEISNKPIDENDYSSAMTALQMLIDQKSDPVIAIKITSSREKIEQFYRQLQKLELYKQLHDAFHTIEAYFLQPIQAQGAKYPVKVFKTQFDGNADLILQQIENSEIEPGLRRNITNQIEITRNAFENAVDNLNKDAYLTLLSELNTLLSDIPTRLDDRIVNAAYELKLDSIADLLAELQDILHAGTTTITTDAEPFISGIDAFRRLGNELELRVKDHALLQQLDSELRMVCTAKMGLSDRNWNSIRRRALDPLVPPFSIELSNSMENLIKRQEAIEKALDMKDKKKINSLISDYFRYITSTFMKVDTSLKNMCNQLSKGSLPRIRMLLDL